MDGLTWYHADLQLRELRVLDLIDSADMQVDISDDAELIDNTWSITIPESVWAKEPILKGHYVYAPYTEWGGPVTYVKHDTNTRQITVQGPTWRGVLMQKIIYPPSGQAYLVLEDVDANTAISTAAGSGLGTLFAVDSDPAGVNVSAQFRYQYLAKGLEKLFRANGLRLAISFDPSIPAAVLSAVPVQDLTTTVEISQDYGVNFSSTQGNVEEANHCLALGQGELTDRMVRNVYRVGNTYYSDRPASLPESALRTVKLDYPNAETETELINEAIDRLREKASVQSIDVDEVTIDLSVDLGDMISVRDRTTGLAAKTEARKKILTISQGRTAIALTVAALLEAGSTLVLRIWGDLVNVTWNDAAAYTWGYFIEN